MDKLNVIGEKWQVAVPPANGKRDLEDEIKKYRKALENDPGSRLFVALADSLRRSGDVRGAIEVAAKGVERHPNYISGIVVLAQACHEDRRYEMALGFFQKVVKMNPENLLAHRNLAEIYDRLGDHGRAMEAYRAITILDPGDRKAREQLKILEATAPTGTDAQPPPPEPAEEEIVTGTEMEVEEPEPGEPGPAEEAREEDGRPGTVEPETEGEELRSEGMPAKSVTTEGQEKQGPEPEEAQEAIETEKTPDPGKESPRPEAAVKDADEDTDPALTPPPQVSPPSRKQPAEKDKYAAEEKKLDMFFDGADLSELGIAVEADGFVVRDAAGAVPEKALDREEDGRIPGQDRNAFEIKTSVMGRVFWKQGFLEKALEVMAEQIKERPDDLEIRAEFEAACEKAGKKPDEIMAAEKKEEEEESKKESPENESAGSQEEGNPGRARRAEGAGAEETDEERSDVLESGYLRKPPESGDGDGAQDKMGVPASKKIGVLKGYLGRIKTSKEKKT
jgi:tetratricopeptide (TPR) repeat protein